MDMTVYADVLILLNFIVDYLILSVCVKILSTYVKPIRLIFGSLIGALLSLAIFLPYFGVCLEILFIILSSALISVVTFGVKGFKLFLKRYAVFLMVNIIYNGLMTALWIFVKPNSMAINNGITYFNISPFEFIIAAVVFYLIIRIFQIIIKKHSPSAKRCNVRLKNNNRELSITALIDTGNNLVDPYNGKPVVITDKSTAEQLYGSLSSQPDYLLPISSVKGGGLIGAYRCEAASIENREEMPVLVAIAESSFNEDYKAIINPDILI